MISEHRNDGNRNERMTTRTFGMKIVHIPSRSHSEWSHAPNKPCLNMFDLSVISSLTYGVWLLDGCICDLLTEPIHLLTPHPFPLIDGRRHESVNTTPIIHSQSRCHL